MRSPVASTRRFACMTWARRDVGRLVSILSRFYAYLQNVYVQEVASRGCQRPGLSGTAARQLISVFEDYVDRYGITGTLFPYTPRLIEQLLSAAARQAGISKRVTVGILRDLFVVRSVKRGMQLEEVFEKIGLAKSSYDDARKKYGRLTPEAL